MGVNFPWGGARIRTKLSALEPQAPYLLRGFSPQLTTKEEKVEKVGQSPFRERGTIWPVWRKTSLGSCPDSNLALGSGTPSSLLATGT